MADASMTAEIEFSLNTKLDRGVNVVGLISSLIGAAALIFGTGGLVLAVGVLGIVVSFTKSIYSFFDSDFKKAQQRKAANENIDNKFQDIKSSYVSQLRENMQKLEVKLTPVMCQFELPAQQTKKITLSLNESVEQLDLVSKKIKKLGGI